MEIENLVSALEETLVYLQNSEDSAYTHMSVDEIIEKLEPELAKAKNAQSIDARLVSFLFAPTGAIQDTAIDNGWEDIYLRISDVIDKFTVDR